jgi:CheY-like chemotaxis protein
MGWTVAEEPARALFVDDEENVLHALSRQLRHRVRAELTTSPLEAVGLLEQAAAAGAEPFAVIVSDMRMPGMDGAALLKRSLEISPDTSRVLLTGYADLPSALAAVNEGSIFRFLTKPCPVTQLYGTLAAAVEQHRLLRDRRELLDRTLRGAVEALMDTLAMAHPAAFARASRLRRLGREVTARLAEPEGWQVEVAAQLGEIGVVTLPPEALEALERGTPPGPSVAAMLAALPDLADAVLRRIPRLEAVREIVRTQQPVDATNPTALAHASRPARILQAVREYDSLIVRDHEAALAVQLLRTRTHHDEDILDALQVVVSAQDREAAGEVDVTDLRPGLVLAADLRSGTGMLLVKRGHELTPELVARIRNFAVLSGLQGRPIVVRKP